MKILLCKGRFAGPVSGADETVVTYATHLKANGHDISVVLLHESSPQDNYYTRLIAAGVPVFSILGNSAPHSIWSQLRGRIPHIPRGPRRVLHKTSYALAARNFNQCKTYFEYSGANIIHVVTPDPGATIMIRAAHAAGIPVLYQELGTADYLAELEFYYQQLFQVLPLCSEVAALSPRLAHDLELKFPVRKSPVVIPLIVDSVADNIVLNGAHKSGRHDVRAPVFGFAARLEYGKGPLQLIEAFAALHRRLPQARLSIAGTGPQELEAKARAAALGIAEACHFQGVYTGHAGQSAFMQNIDVFVLPSLAEGTPNSVIEAMAHGVPVIASAVGGIPDVVTSDTGILTEPGDTAALEMALLHLAEDPERRAQMGRAARSRYEQLFSPEAALPALLEAYRQVVSRSVDGEINESQVQNAANYRWPHLETNNNQDV